MLLALKCLDALFEDPFTLSFREALSDLLHEPRTLSLSCNSLPSRRAFHPNFEACWRQRAGNALFSCTERLLPSPPSPPMSAERKSRVTSGQMTTCREASPGQRCGSPLAAIIFLFLSAPSPDPVPALLSLLALSYWTFSLSRPLLAAHSRPLVSDAFF